MGRTRDIRLISVFAITGAVSLTLLPACVLGPSPGRYAVVQSAAGLPVEIVVASEGGLVDVSGELLAVDRSGFLLRRPGAQIVRVDTAAIESARFEVLRLRLPRDGPLSDADWTRLRVHSRHPEGMTPEFLARYLASAGQSVVIEYDRP